MKNLPPVLALLAGLFLNPANAADPDYEREARIAEQIEDSILTGESVWLEADGRKFLTIHAEANDTPIKGAVILVHGMGVHPNWPSVIYPLRTSLIEHGWDTLSVQMPVMPGEAVLEDYLPVFTNVKPRLDAAVSYLQERNIRQIFIVGHSLGALMASHYVANASPDTFRGLVAVGLSSGQKGHEADAIALLGKITIPVLDIYGSEDLNNIVEMAEARAASAKRSGNPGYRQVEIAGADHFFADLDPTLIKRVGGWIHQTLEDWFAAQKSGG